MQYSILRRVGHVSLDPHEISLNLSEVVLVVPIHLHADHLLWSASLSVLQPIIHIEDGEPVVYVGNSKHVVVGVISNRLEDKLAQ